MTKESEPVSLFKHDCVLSLCTSIMVIDITQTKTPNDSPPQSSWQLGSNKGVSSSNGFLQITFLDEQLDGNKYTIKAEVKNIVHEELYIGSSDFYLKDAKGHLYKPDFSSVSQFGNIYLGEETKDLTTFSVDNSNQNFMVLYD